MTFVGVLVKYNPCSVYARLGKPCPSFVEARPCAKNFGPCQMPEYDFWFKEVLKGRIRCFYPKRIRLLEIRGTILVLFHCQKRELVGEARIVKSTLEGNSHRYWFNEFLVYPNPVSLKVLRAKKKVKNLPVGGRWWLLYIDEEILEEIRKASGLDRKTREELKKQLGITKKEVEKFRFGVYRKLFDIQEEMEKLSSSDIDQAILQKSRELFSKAVELKIVRSRSSKILFYSCLHLAYRILGIPRKLGDTAKIEGFDKKAFASAVNLLTSKLEIKLPKISPDVWIRHYSDHLKIPKKATEMAIFLARKASKNRRLISKSPLSLSATATYIACLRTNTRIQQEKIAETFGVTAATIRNLSKIWFVPISSHNEKLKRLSQTSTEVLKGGIGGNRDAGSQ